VSLPIIIPPNSPSSYSPGVGTIGKFLADLPSGPYWTPSLTIRIKKGEKSSNGVACIPHFKVRSQLKTHRHIHDEIESLCFIPQQINDQNLIITIINIHYFKLKLNSLRGNLSFHNIFETGCFVCFRVGIEIDHFLVFQMVRQLLVRHRRTCEKHIKMVVGETRFHW
jgi:hypothetical protein